MLEEELKKYFGQYGTITNVMVVRSKKTARSKGYGFIEFEYPEVAAIAAKSMNGHMILSKVLECKVLEGTQHNPFEGKTSDEFKFINWKKIYQVKINQEKDEGHLAKQVSKLLEKEREKRKKLKECGIDYEFPGYEQLIGQSEKPARKASKGQKEQVAEEDSA